MEFDSCRLTGHFKGSMACKGKPAQDRTKTRKGRANQIDKSEEGSEAEDKDFIWAAGI